MSRLRTTTTTSLLLTLIFLTGCVSSNNLCGNENRDWDNLTFSKKSYCSVPGFLPLREQFEAANRSVCKVHDNNRGIAGTMNTSEADWRFLCDYIKRSELPWGVRHITGYMSYLAVRVASPEDQYQSTASELKPAFIDAEQRAGENN